LVWLYLPDYYCSLSVEHEQYYASPRESHAETKSLLSKSGLLGSWTAQDLA
jgi:hypothetical protein